MRSAYTVTALLLALSAATLLDFTPARASTGPIPLNCDRACLEDLVNQYLAAVVAHDPRRLPLSQDVRYTENDQIMEIGDGFWKTAEAMGNYKHYFADPEFGQVAFMGTMREAGAPLLLSLRLRVQLGRITEVESVYYRQGGGGPSGIADMDKPYQPEDFWFQSIPVSQRMSREELIAVADGYFTGLKKTMEKASTAPARIRSPTTVIASRTARRLRTCRGPPGSRPTRSTPSRWTVWRSSSSGSTSWCRTSMTAATRWSTPKEALCGRMPSSIKAP